MFIRINYLRKNEFFDLPAPTEGEVKQGDFVILDVGEGRKEVGKIVFMHDHETSHDSSVRLLRKASLDDISKIERLTREEREAFSLFMKKIKEYKLQMQPVSVFFSFDERHADLVFTAEDRVDFRALVKDLASLLKKKIFLQQVGSRDRASLMDGCGSCGRKLCCSTFLRDRPPVGMKAARKQDLFAKDRDKLTGLCGKLKCCLNYEVSTYERLAKNLPKMDTRVKVISSGMKGKVVGRNILNQMVKIVFSDEGRGEFFPLEDVEIVHKEE